jgi:hypothetical protein
MKRSSASMVSMDHHGRSRRSIIRGVLSCILVTIVCLGLWAWVIKLEMDAMSPPPNVKTFEEFAAVMPPPTWLAAVTHGNELSIVWRGDRCGPVFVPSGPACYLFDSRGTLLQWSPDTGDGSALDDFALEAARRPNQTVDDIRAILKKGGEQSP